MTSGADSVCSPSSPYIGDEGEHYMSSSALSVCPLAPLSRSKIQRSLGEGGDACLLWVVLLPDRPPQTDHYNKIIMIRAHERARGSCGRGPTHEITPVRGQSSQGAYAEDRGICILAVVIPSVYLLLRRGEYTRVYTTVYLRVHNCIPTCTQPRSKYVPRRALAYSSPRG